MRITKKGAVQAFEEAPIGTPVFVWGKGFVSDGIRIFQKLESQNKIYELQDKVKGIDYGMPTHVETKIGPNEVMSAEFSGIKKMKFDRHLKKDYSLALALPKISFPEDKKWQEDQLIFLYKQEGKKYDVGGFLSYIPRMIWYKTLYKLGLRIGQWDWEMAWYCSELACEALLKWYKLDNDKHFEKLDSGTVSPAELILACNHSNSFDVVGIT
jgi:hypothetical protein